MAATIQSLSSELLLMIFGNVSQTRPKDIWSIAFVCKDWYPLAKEFWISDYHVNPLNLKSIRGFLSRLLSDDSWSARLRELSFIDRIHPNSFPACCLFSQAEMRFDVQFISFKSLLSLQHKIPSLPEDEKELRAMIRRKFPSLKLRSFVWDSISPDIHFYLSLVSLANLSALTTIKVQVQSSDSRIWLAFANILNKSPCLDSVSISARNAPRRWARRGQSNGPSPVPNPDPRRIRPPEVKILSTIKKLELLDICICEPNNCELWPTMFDWSTITSLKISCPSFLHLRGQEMTQITSLSYFIHDLVCSSRRALPQKPWPVVLSELHSLEELEIFNGLSLIISTPDSLKNHGRTLKRLRIEDTPELKQVKNGFRSSRKVSILDTVEIMGQYCTALQELVVDAPMSRSKIRTLIERITLLLPHVSKLTLNFTSHSYEAPPEVVVNVAYCRHVYGMIVTKISQRAKKEKTKVSRYPELTITATGYPNKCDQVTRCIPPWYHKKRIYLINYLVAEKAISVQCPQLDEPIHYWNHNTLCRSMQVGNLEETHQFLLNGWPTNLLRQPKAGDQQVGCFGPLYPKDLLLFRFQLIDGPLKPCFCQALPV